MLDLALAGDPAMLRLCMDKIVPSLRPTDAPVPIALPVGSVVEQGQAVVDALAKGTLTADQAQPVMGVIQGRRRLSRPMT